MDSKAPKTVDTIAKVAEGKIDTVNAAKLLNKSRRAILGNTKNNTRKKVKLLDLNSHDSLL